MENPQHFECDTPDCCYWSEDGCTKGTAITIQEHHCVDYEEQPKPGSLTVKETWVERQKEDGTGGDVCPATHTMTHEQKKRGGNNGTERTCG